MLHLPRAGLRSSCFRVSPRTARRRACTRPPHEVVTFGFAKLKWTPREIVEELSDTRLGVRRMARDTPRYVLSAGLDESLPKLQSSYGISLQLSGRSETDVPGEQRAFTEAKTTLDAFWLYKVSPKFNLRLSGQNLLKEDTVREVQYMSAANTWQLRTVDGGYRTLMATLEGRW